MTGGSLRKYLHQQEPHSVPLNLVLKLALDISRGMQYLHSQGILHRDLKSENLLLGEDMCVKVADFGISCLESQCGSAKGFTGTYRWMAPEMIKEKHHTKKVDVYSFGIVLWELLTALTPFDNLTPEQAAFAVCQKVTFNFFRYQQCQLKSPHLLILASVITISFMCSFNLIILTYVSALQNARPPLPSACPQAFRHLIKRCWSRNPDKRPHFDEIVSVLETYVESYNEDPEFFCHYVPSSSSRCTAWRCLPKCITKQSSATLKPRNSSSS